MQYRKKQMALHTLVRSSMSCHNLLRIILSLLFISTILHTASASNSTATTNALINTYKKFIKDECNATIYPNVCYNSLSPYASKIKTNPLTLTKISVNLALKSARSASTKLKKLSKSKGKNLTHAETEVIADCRENIDSTVDLLEQSAESLAHLNGTTTNDERFQCDNIKTWISAAITDESTCTDELQVRPSLQRKIKPNVAYVAWMDSIALALVNRLCY